MPPPIWTRHWEERFSFIPKQPPDLRLCLCSFVMIMWRRREMTPFSLRFQPVVVRSEKSSSPGSMTRPVGVGHGTPVVRRFTLTIVVCKAVPVEMRFWQTLYTAWNYRNKLLTVLTSYTFSDPRIRSGLTAKRTRVHCGNKNPFPELSYDYTFLNVYRQKH